MENIIEVKNLTKNFKKFCAVDDVSFDIKKGEIFGFLGPNGAGKSTTIRMLVTLLRPTSGVATVSGFDIVKNQDEVRKHIGLVAEKIILYPHLTARENLNFFGELFHLTRSQIEERTEKWVSRLHMKEWLDTQTGSFSTGMKQRINIVRALLTEPDILFLDEPTLGLDPQTTHLIRNFVEELNKQGVTILLTTHDMLEAEELCDRIAIIDHGKISALDTVENLKKQVTGKVNPTMEDVFLEITGKEIRDNANETIKSISGPGRHMGGQTNNRVR
jgi:ABC-2 type transport system ATP-binding protein